MDLQEPRLTARRKFENGVSRGGRPTKMDGEALEMLRELLANGKSHAECADELRVSARTIGRVVARLKGVTMPELGIDILD